MEDGPTTGANANNATRFERAKFAEYRIPAGGAYVTVDFDICYNTEDLSQYVPTLGVEAFDGAHLRITDFTTGHAALAVWAESFAETFTTGTASRTRNMRRDRTAVQLFPGHSDVGRRFGRL